MADLSFKKEFLDSGIVTNAKSWCFGKEPVVSPIQVGFAAGANKFSSCAGYTFTCPKNEKYPTLKVVYCAKLHSKIWHKDPANMSRWFLWQPVGKSGVIVLDSDKCEEEYGFDFYKFFKTDAFKQGQTIFKKTIKRGIEEAKTLRSEVKAEDQQQYDEWIKSLEEAAELITNVPELNEKSYQMVDFDKFIRELHKNGYGEELKTRGAIKQKVDLNIAHRFMDKVKKNELKPGEQDNR